MSEGSHHNFDTWLQWVFDHPVTDPAWYWNDKLLEPPPEVTVDYLTRLFCSPVSRLACYSDAQVNQGLWFLCSNACSSHLDAFLDEDVPIHKRLHGVASIFDLYREVFATRCASELSHGRNRTTNPLNSVCFMFWDIAPLLGTQGEQMRAAILEVLRRISTLSHVACIESAIHGLGHASSCGYSEATEVLNDIISSGVCPSDLLAYAHRAKDGDIE